MIPIGSHGRGGVMDILGDCGSPDPGSIPGPGPLNSKQFFKSIYQKESY